MKNIILLSTALSSLIYAAGPVYKTGQTESYNLGDDYSYQKGLVSSFNSQINGDIILDSHLNLEWMNDQKITDPNDRFSDNWPEGNYTEAVKNCKALTPINTWRLPTRLEAKTIFSFSNGFPFVNKHFSDSVGADYMEEISGYGSTKAVKFWTATKSATDDTKAWIVDFYNGIDRAPEDIAISHNIRCVNGEMNIQSSYDRSNGIVTDKITKLMWQDDYDNNPNTQSDPIPSDTWVNAIDYCENLTDLGYNDWRLPNATELYFITDDTKYNPAIDTVFQSTGNIYWSSTTLQSNSNYKVTVKFIDGGDSGADKSESHLIRCVRGGINSQATLPSIINYLLN